MKILVNFADDSFRASQMRNSETGRAVGGFDEVWSFGPADIDGEFAARNRKILSQNRGVGLWLWKPYFIHRGLQRIGQDDSLFYCDAGSHFIGSIDPLVELSKSTGQELVCFGLIHPERNWTKRDAFVLLDCDEPYYTESTQRLASFSLWRKSERMIEFARQWLSAACDERMLSDEPNVMGLPNYAGFEDHRHDQSLFSLLTKKWCLPAFRDPSQYGNLYVADFPECTYPQLIEHTRAKRMPLRQKVTRETRRFAQQLRRALSR